MCLLGESLEGLVKDLAGQRESVIASSRGGRPAKETLEARIDPRTLATEPNEITSLAEPDQAA
ncbi:MAG: hypothetical protein ACRDJK_02095 [Actinomycetota bacterium]